MRALLKNTMRKMFVLGAQTLPLSWYRRLTHKPVLTLCYHAVSDAPLAHIRHYPVKSAREFENDIIYLKKHYRVLTYEEFRTLPASGGSTKTPSALITFDDGFAECFTVVRPILLKHKVSAVFFVTTGFLDNTMLAPEHTASLCLLELEMNPSEETLRKINEATDARFATVASVASFLEKFEFTKIPVINAIARSLGVDSARYARQAQPFLTTDQTRALSEEGFTIGGHAVTHTRLDLLPQVEARDEIIASCKGALALTKQERVPFAFPHHGIRMDTNLLAWIKKEYAFIDLFFDAGWVWDESGFMRNRVWVDSRWAAGPGRSNLPRLLRLAYADYLRRKKIGMKR